MAIGITPLTFCTNKKKMKIPFYISVSIMERSIYKWMVHMIPSKNKLILHI